MSEIYVESLGTGADVVFFHGVPQSPEEFGPWARDLATEFRTHVVHLPGYGRSAPFEGAYDLAAVADDVGDALHDRGVVEAAYIGMSAGFYRALQLALSPRAPKAWALVGLGPVALFDDEARALFRGTADAVSAGIDISELLVSRFLSPEFAAAHPDACAHAARAIEAAPAETIAGELAAIAECADLDGRLSELDCPLCLRTGERDVAAPPDVVRVLAAAARNASVDIVPGAGHLLQIEDCGGTLDAMRETLLAARPRAH